MRMIWAKGNWCAEEDFSLAVRDRAVLHGMSAFETMLAIDGELQHAEKHLARLQQAISTLGLYDPSGYDLRAIARELCEKNHCQQGRARLRFTVTAGAGSLGQGAVGAGATAWLSAESYTAAAGPCRVLTLPWRRSPRTALTGLKCGSYAENIAALQWVTAQQADEGIFFNTADELCEACTATVFVKIRGELWTPHLDSGCLPGVMRAVILEAASEQGIAVRESAISREQFFQAESLYLSSALRGVSAVSSCDGRELMLDPFPVTLARPE